MVPEVFEGSGSIFESWNLSRITGVWKYLEGFGPGILKVSWGLGSEK